MNLAFLTYPTKNETGKYSFHVAVLIRQPIPFSYSQLADLQVFLLVLNSKNTLYQREFKGIILLFGSVLWPQIFPLR